jgi:hypothetical protein
MGGNAMNRGFVFMSTQSKVQLRTGSRKQRLTAIKAVIAHLERISNAERRHMNLVRDATGLRCESELIASIIDEAIFILETLQ